MPTVTVAAAGESATVDYGGGGVPLPTGWSRVAFFDDFTGDLSKWNVRNNTYASNEMSVDLARNAVLDGQVLTLRAKREQAPAGGTTRGYTSAYLDTIGKFSQRGGRWEIRCKLPAAKGMWPAFWLRCNDTPSGQVLGEIDVFEAVGGYPSIVQTVHQSTNGGQNKLGYEWKPPAGWTYTDWHTYALEWDSDTGAMRWYIDDKLTVARSTTDLDNPSKKPAAWLSGPNFSTPSNIRLNLQVGGSMPTGFGLNVDATSVLPADFTVDFVRVLTR